MQAEPRRVEARDRCSFRGFVEMYRRAWIGNRLFSEENEDPVRHVDGTRC